jgi:hypothetical protein
MLEGIKGDLERSSRSLKQPLDNRYSTDQTKEREDKKETKERGDRQEKGDLGKESI